MGNATEMNLAPKLTKEQIQNKIRETYFGKDWQRTAFVIEELAHALVNIPREWLRKIGAPETAWPDLLSKIIIAFPIAILLLMIATCWL